MLPLDRNYSSIYVPIFIFFFNDTATTEIYTLSLHDALPICYWSPGRCRTAPRRSCRSIARPRRAPVVCSRCRSEEHTSELQSLAYLVCRLLLEKKNITLTTTTTSTGFASKSVPLTAPSHSRV